MSWFKPAPIPTAGYRVLASEVAPPDPDEDPPRRLARRALFTAATLFVIALAIGGLVQLVR